jgi:transcriptional regulator with XRE-family HTH domain
MFDRCIGCDRLGKDCVPNLMALPFPDLMNWWKKRQALLDWTNQELADKSGIPVGTINRIRKGEDDPRYSTMRSIIHALMGSHSAEFPCQKKLDAEFAHIEELEKHCIELTLEKEALLAKLQTLAELHRNDMLAIREEYQERIELLKANNAILRWQCIHQQENT